MTLPTQLQDKRTLITISLLAFLVISGSIVLFNIRNTQEIRRKAATNDAHIELVSIASKSLDELVAGDTFSIHVAVRSADNDIYGVDLQFAFDQNVIKVNNPLGNEIEYGSNVRNGCDIVGTETPVVFAPITATDVCDFKMSDVVSAANDTAPGSTTGGTLEFGVAAFDWDSADTPGYIPAPLPADPDPTNFYQLVTIHFEAIADGSTTLALNWTPGITTDANVAAIDTGLNDAVDVLGTTGYNGDNNATGFNIVVGGGAPTPPQGPCTTQTCDPALYNNGYLLGDVGPAGGDCNLGGFELSYILNNVNCGLGSPTTPGNCSQTCDPALYNNGYLLGDVGPAGGDCNLGGFELSYILNNVNCGLP
jgi:hypothetical protein